MIGPFLSAAALAGAARCRRAPTAAACECASINVGRERRRTFQASGGRWQR